jgi:hypothetical protein
VAQERERAIAAYQLVRAVTLLAAQQAGVAPPAYRFTPVRTVVQAFAPLLATAKDAYQAQPHFDRMRYYSSPAKPPQRSRQRSSYPRAVWPERASFPNRKA